MTVEEVRTIKETMSLETIGMSVGELHTYYSKGADEIKKRVEEKRAGNGTEKKVGNAGKSA